MDTKFRCNHTARRVLDDGMGNTMVSVGATTGVCRWTRRKIAPIAQPSMKTRRAPHEAHRQTQPAGKSARSIRQDGWPKSISKQRRPVSDTGAVCRGKKLRAILGQKRNAVVALFVLECWRREAESLGHFHQLCERVGLHLSHHFASVCLHRDLADAELPADLFIQQAGNHQLHNLVFARGE